MAQVSNSCGRRQAQAVPDREVVVVPHTRHFVMLDDVDGFSAAVEQFLAKHEAVASNLPPGR